MVIVFFGFVWLLATYAGTQIIASLMQDDEYRHVRTPAGRFLHVLVGLTLFWLLFSSLLIHP